jgi:hypothetical protein
VLQAEAGDRPGLRGDWPVPVADLMVWPAVRDGEPLVRSDLQPSRQLPGSGPAGLGPQPDLRSGAARRHPIALLYAAHDRPDSSPGLPSRRTAALADTSATALVNARLYRALAVSESQLRVYTEELRRQATHDSLTGLGQPGAGPELLEIQPRLERERPGRSAVLRSGQVQGGERPPRPRGR